MGAEAAKCLDRHSKEITNTTKFRYAGRQSIRHATPTLASTQSRSCLKPAIPRSPGTRYGEVSTTWFSAVSSRCQKRADGSRLRSEQYLHVEHVFFSRPKTTAETDAERSTEEAIEVPESVDGIDESGFFPENEVLEDTTNE